MPETVLFGAQTQRALDNFGLHSRPVPAEFIRCLALVKAAAALANRDCGALDEETSHALVLAAKRVADGELADQFPLSVFQTGSGTSTNMNMNEVLARVASNTSGRNVHPNDHANCSQSSNDVIPSCIQVASTIALRRRLVPALGELIDVTDGRAEELSAVAKTARTHLMDAMPITLGQEIDAWGRQLQECRQRLEELEPRLRKLPIGGSAVGTGVNVPSGFAQRVVHHLEDLTGVAFELAPNPSSRMAGQDVALECSACLRALAITLRKVNDDLRWMASGPLSGLAEIELEALQPGSSIMPGKVNPVLPEAVLMVAADVVGNDAAVAVAAQSGNFQLNVMLPLIAEKLCAGFEALCWACEATGRAVSGFKVNHERIDESLASNPMLVTALNTRIGYEAAAVIAKRSYRERRPVLDVAEEETGLSRDELRSLLDPLALARAKGAGER